MGGRGGGRMDYISAIFVPATLGGKLAKQLHKVAGRNASPTRWPAPTAMTRNARHVTRARARPGPVAPTTWSSVKAGPFHSSP